jgi:hypothetical protein
VLRDSHSYLDGALSTSAQGRRRRVPRDLLGFPTLALKGVI